jgi:NADPH2:quinone reductase
LRIGGAATGEDFCMRAIRIERTGGPEVMALVEVALPEPKPSEIRIRHEAIGVNFIDVYHRSGLYPLRLPSGLGSEGAGIVDAVGEGVTRFSVGDPVVHNGGGIGAYAEAMVVNQGRAVKRPAGIDAQLAAASMLKGLTAEYLLRRCVPVHSGQPILIHAAAGGTGSILVQWAKHLGAIVIATAGSEEKRAIVRGLGADHVLNPAATDLSDQVRALTDGRGVEIVYDGVGAATFDASLASLARRGWMVSFGNASGPVPPIDPLRLSRAGSLYFTRPTAFDYVTNTSELDEASAALFDVLESGAVRVAIGAEWPLAEAAEAHRALESRATTGSSLLIP